MSTQPRLSPNRQRAAAPPPPAPAAPPAAVLQRRVDEAAYFNLSSLAAAPEADASVRGTAGVTGVAVEEALYRLVVTPYAPSAKAPVHSANAVGECVGKFSHRWLMIPDDFVAAPGLTPPPTALDTGRAQRFVMLDATCVLGEGADGFHGFGTGRTLLATVNGRPQLLATAVGTILQGFGRFAGHEDGTYLYCGSLSARTGFTGNLLLRVMDPQNTLRTDQPLPAIRPRPDPEPGVTYVVLRGEAVPDDPVAPNLAPDGRRIGLVVQQGLKLQYCDCAATDEGGVRAASRWGQRIGRVTAFVTFDPASASGAALDPVPFTAYDEFVFFNREGETIGSFTASSSEGRVFNTSLLSQPAIRFGGVGTILGGTGPFQGIEGLMTDNSLVVFTPHVSASVYVLRIPDPRGKFRAALGAS
jgi:hypothetical protein